jgi:hypothetical protein
MVVLLLVIAWAWNRCSLVGYLGGPEHCGTETMVGSTAQTANQTGTMYPLITGVGKNRKVAATAFQAGIWM